MLNYELEDSQRTRDAQIMHDHNPLSLRFVFSVAVIPSRDYLSMLYCRSPILASGQINYELFKIIWTMVIKDICDLNNA